MPKATSKNDVATMLLAFLEAERAVDLETSRAATARLLDSLGNNHAGTYRSIVLDAMPKFASVLDSGNAWSQRTVLEVLIDLCGSFKPDPEELDHEGLADVLVAKVRAMKQGVEVIARSDSISATSANALLEVL